ncbi:MAG: hypothetical protein CYG60_07865 [Actinobacteria bacterium]|nr:MAG: hypothetical protein CYG60_07865 [Actinomycetota bacterium]
MTPETTNTDSRITPEFAEELLSLPALEEQAELLRGAGLLNPDGLDRLLDFTERLAPGDPGTAHRMAELCADLAEPANAPTATPRASYIRVRTLNERGEFDEALRMVRAAHDGYIALGMYLEALRTNLGLMVTLLERGRYQEALDAGQVVLDALDGKSELDVRATRTQSDLLSANVYQNIGSCLEYMGRYDETLEAYALAEKLFQKLGMTERVGEIIDNRSAILLQLGRGAEALVAREVAADIFDKANLALSHAKALANVGETHLRLGNYIRGLDAFERARCLLESLDALADEHLLARDMANAYLELNLYSEAIAAYQKADSLLSTAGMVHDRARLLWGKGSALAAQSEFDNAEHALEEAADLFTRAGNVPLRSGVMLEQASLMEARGDTGKALALAFRALHLVSSDEWPVHHAYAHLRLADLLLPDLAEAESHLLEAQRLISDLSLTQLRYRLEGRLGRVRLLQGREEEAQALLERAVAGIEDSRNTVAQEAMRASFLRDKTDAYEDLLQLHLAHDDGESRRRAFVVAEQAKSRALVDLLAGAGEASSGSGDSEIESEIGTLQADLNAIYNRLLGSVAEDENVVLQPSLQARAAELEREISRLRLQSAVVADARDPFAVPSSLEDFREHLPPDTTLLAYHIIGDEIVAFVITRDHVEAVRGVARSQKSNGSCRG